MPKALDDSKQQTKMKNCTMRCLLSRGATQHCLYSGQAVSVKLPLWNLQVSILPTI